MKELQKKAKIEYKYNPRFKRGFCIFKKNKSMPSQFSSYSKEEIKQKLKKQQLFVNIKVVVIILMAILAVFSTIEKGVSSLTFLPLFFIPMLFIMLNELKKLKKELAERK